jgi:uncharacterized cupin superfamily protein
VEKGTIMDGLAVFASLNVSDFVPNLEEDGVTVVEGDPQLHVNVLHEGKEMESGVATVKPSTFDYLSTHATMVELLEGAATVTADGNTVELKAGEAAFLEKGSVTRWEVTAPIREFFVSFLVAH